MTDVFPAATHQMKERENPKKKTSSRASVKYIYQYIESSGECEEKKPQTRNPHGRRNKGGVYARVYIMYAKYRDTKRDGKKRIISKRAVSPPSSKTEVTDSRPFHPNADNGLTAVALLSYKRSSKSGPVMRIKYPEKRASP